MRHLLFAVAALLSVTSCDKKPNKPEVKVDGAWVQLPAIAGRPGAAYFSLTSSTMPETLLRVTSPDIQRIELHSTNMDGGMARMAMLEEARFADDRRLVFEPGGKHAMLFGINPALKAGDKITLAFTFDRAPPVSAEAEVRAFGADHGGH